MANATELMFCVCWAIIFGFVIGQITDIKAIVNWFKKHFCLVRCEDCKHVNYEYRIADLFEELMAESTKIVCCKDCAKSDWYEQGEERRYYCLHFSSDRITEDGFCKYGEPKEG